MMPELPTLIAELDATLVTATAPRQVAILRNVTDLFLVGSGAYTEDHVAIFDDVIGRLIVKAEAPALIELSTRLAPIDNAPANVIAKLAGNDDISISGPILERSSALNEQTLADIAGRKSQKHLAAIVSRNQLSATVTDFIIGRGGPDIARRVATNLGAQISELGFVKLIGRAKADKPLAVAIASRNDIPPELTPFLKLALA